MIRQTTTVITGALTALGIAVTAHAAPSQDLDFHKGTCESAAHHMEQVEDIPTHLLTAISLAETGRWDKEEEANFAWPWTVTAEGKGNYYPSKQVAIAAVKQLKAKGVRNIDVGCMQINLRYHPDAFADLNQAFDPTINIAYASDFLHQKRKATGSWTEAAAAYHSATPRYNRKYKMKILKLWNEVRRRTPAIAPDPATPAGHAMAAASPEPFNARGGVFFGAVPSAKTELSDSVDQPRTRFLNKALQARRKGEDTLNLASRRMNQLDSWRSKQFADGGQHLAIMRRAEKDTERRLQRAGVRPRAETFADNRRKQMEAWRMMQAPTVEIIPEG